MRIQGLLLLAALLGADGLASAGTAVDAVYNEANALYRKGLYDEAAVRYEEALGQGVRNGTVHYNLGNAYFKAGDLGRAILAYERALSLMPGDEDLRTNLRFVNALKVDREPEAEDNVVVQSLSYAYRSLGADGLTAFSSACLFLLSGIGVAWLYVPERRTAWVGLALALAFALSGSGLLAGFKIHERETVRHAVILAEEVVGRSGPGEDYVQVFALHEGTKVRLERSEGQWRLVRLSSGPGGWVLAEAMEGI